jgi:CDP-diacylglycerol--glycerol-3-phosphate 3-phosphatidyltransferase
VAAVIGILLLLCSFFWLQSWWLYPYPLRWLLVSGLAMCYLLWVLWNGLGDNHRQGETELLGTFGLGNLLSIGRGYIMVLFCGFLFSPWPDHGWTAWLPGLLYTLAALPDFVDGIAARLTNHVTQLGESLDMSIDSIGVLGVTLLSVQYGQAPWLYLLVGLARYIFIAGIWLRNKLDLPVHDLRFSVRRRGYAALGMGLFFVILYPIFTPPGTHAVALIFSAYILGGFLWDWLATIGWLPATPSSRYQDMEYWIVQYVPLVLRLILVLWLLNIFGSGMIVDGGSILLWMEAGAALCLILGIAGRINAVVALVVLGLYQAAAPLDTAQLGLLVLYTNLLFLGTGKFSLWPVENRLIFRRIGDPR